ncbi:MAG: ABC transporter ATP-binding protein [Streptosporangiaceae bacterium]
MSIRGLHAGYGRVQVLHGIDLTLKPGELTCVLGANGAGKTTLAKAISGALRAQDGEIRLDGAPITSWSPERRSRHGVVLVPQGRCVFANLTVAQNLEVARFAARKRRTDASGLAAELFPRLAQLRDRKAGVLSGGEQQMLAIARGLAAEPEVLVLDEPSLGCAPVIVEALYEAIRVVTRLRMAILLIEQVAEHALSVADDVVVLRGGEIVDRGTAADFTSGGRLSSHYLGD